MVFYELYKDAFCFLILGMEKHLGTVLALQLTNTFFLILSSFDTNSFSGNTHRHTVVPGVSVTSFCIGNRHTQSSKYWY